MHASGATAQVAGLANPIASRLDLRRIETSSHVAILILPGHMRFATNAIQPTIDPSVISAFAATAGAVMAAQHAPHLLSHDTLQFHFMSAIAAGTPLRAEARIVGGRIQIDIQIASDRALVAQATIDLPTLTRTDLYQGDTEHVTQPYYPV